MLLAKTFLPFLMCLLIPVFASSQRSIYLENERSNEGGVLSFNFSYGMFWPGGDLSNRFGYNFTTGAAIDYITSKNFIFGFLPSFQFGTNVKQDVLANLRNEDGIIFGDDGALSNVKLRERGVYLGGHIGKLFSLTDANRRSGVRVTVGAGFLQHKIRIQDDPQIKISLLNEDYKKGYDRLTNGWALAEFIGYQYMAKNRFVNFIAGFEFIQGFTQSRRSFDFDTRNQDTIKRHDFLSGFRLSWTLPLYVGEDPDEIRY
jgi:hypothetical protein